MSAAKSWHLSGKEGIGTMSRIGRMPITVPAGVTVTIADGNVVTVKGPKGELHRSLRPEMIIKQDGNTITVERPSDDKLHRSLHGLTRSLLHNMIVYFLMIIGFSYFYSTIQFNPVEIANNLKKQGGFIPGFRPGKPTIDFIKKVLNKVTLFGAIYLGIVAICPLILGKIVNNNHLAIGGTSVIIIVGVALETVQALESQMLMRQYKGFLE
jgi:Preprotein translocase subunit SecY